jgi:eukaryotic-like serine/threonine-protein kinase
MVKRLSGRFALTKLLIAFENHPMPLDPKRVQAVFLSAVECHESAARAAVLDREYSDDAELRQRVEVLLRAREQPNSLLDQPIVNRENQVNATSGEAPSDPSEVTGCTFPEGPESAEALSSSPGELVGSEAEGTLFFKLQPDPPAFGERPAPSVSGYEILGELGRGGMGVVYKARQVRLNRPCALKMILGGGHASAESAARFLTEAQAIAQLQHPHIVQIHHIGEADGLPFFELEYVPGGSLDRRLNGTPWSARRAAALIEPVTRGVAEAHRQGIVHRDLKPGNVLLAADGTPKITDFGLAKSLDSDSGLTRTDSIMGSPGYMAPEQAEGKTKQVGPPADVYALGVILYELLTGGPPFRGTTALEILDQVKNAEPVAPSRQVAGLPRDVETIALKCLQKEPEKRYDSAAALADDLHRFLAGEALIARPVPFWERGIKWARRRPAIATLAAAVLMLLAALMGVGVLSYQKINSALRIAEARRTAAEESQREAIKQ